jgi:SET domain-containing protein
MTSPKPFVSPKIEIRRSNLNGVGMFAKEDIKKNEVVFIKGGHILTRKQVFSSSVINSYLPLDDNYFIGATNKEEEKDIKLYINHSCEPNCGVRGEISFVAMTNISMGAELTIDYCMVDNEEYVIDCKCGSPNCRRKISGFDWKLKNLQEKYKGYFARYLQDKIDSGV